MKNNAMNKSNGAPDKQEHAQAVRDIKAGIAREKRWRIEHAYIYWARQQADPDYVPFPIEKINSAHVKYGAHLLAAMRRTGKRPCSEREIRNYLVEDLTRSDFYELSTMLEGLNMVEVTEDCSGLFNEERYALQWPYTHS